MIWRFVSALPATTGNIGTPARAYSPTKLSDSAQKCGGVQRKMMRKRTSGSSPTWPVAATQPITGGSAPGAPAPPPADDDIVRDPALEPHRVDDDIKEDCESQQCRRGYIQHRAERQNGARTKSQPENECFRARYTAAGNWTGDGTRHHTVDVRVVPHIKRPRGPSSSGYAHESNDPGSRVDVSWCDQETNQRSENHQ